MGLLYSENFVILTSTVFVGFTRVTDENVTILSSPVFSRPY